MHQPRVSSLCDIVETKCDTLSHACDKVSEAGHVLQGGACTLWHKVTCTGGVLCSLAAGMGFAPGGDSTALQQCIPDPSHRRRRHAST